MKRNKNDRNDARGLADLVSMGWYREARVRSLDAQYIRSMLLSRQQLLQSRRAVENQIRGALKTLGVMTGSTKSRGFMPRVVALRADNDWLGPVLDPLIAARAAIAKQLRMVSESVLVAAREDAVTQAYALAKADPKDLGGSLPFGRATLYRAGRMARATEPRDAGLGPSGCDRCRFRLRAM
jgi:transposase